MNDLPDDIFPESLSRLPPLKREELDASGKKIFDAVFDPRHPSLAGLQGPSGIWLHSPHIGTLMQDLNRVIRYEVDLTPRLRELAILVAARETDQQFEWTQHEPAALKVGLTTEIIDIVKNRKPVDGLPDKEALIIRFGRELLVFKKPSSGTFAQAVKMFGYQGTVNLAATMAAYVMTGIMLNAVDQQLPADRKPLLPVEE